MKNYMLKFKMKVDTIDCDWRQQTFFFYTEEEMIKFVREGYKDFGFKNAPCHIKVEAAFRVEKLDNNIFKRS